ncbi:MAG: hypothetical protein AAF266_10215 [Planctomycetota bacterium]
MDLASPQDARHALRSLKLSFGVALIAVLSPSAAAAAGWQKEEPFAAADRALTAWLAHSPSGAQRVAEWTDAVDDAPRAARLGRVLLRVASFADERVASLLGEVPGEPPAWFGELGDSAASLRLAIAESLAEEERYDDCLAWVDGIDPETVYAPALLHYLQAVASRATVDDESSAAALEAFADVQADAEESRLGVAREWVIDALRDELAKKAEPMPGIARRMRDVERRLALSEGGDPTQQRQQAILDELDKLIEQLEKQRQQQQAAAGAGGAEPGRPAEESRPSELKGPGEIDRKRLIAGDAWGSLPPAERKRLTQAITRDYPPHYRGLIEDYFRTLASDNEGDDDEDSSLR